MRMLVLEMETPHFIYTLHVTCDIWHSVETTTYQSMCLFFMSCMIHDMWNVKGDIMWKQLNIKACVYSSCHAHPWNVKGETWKRELVWKRGLSDQTHHIFIVILWHRNDWSLECSEYNMRGFLFAFSLYHIQLYFTWSIQRKSPWLH